MFPEYYKSKLSIAILFDLESLAYWFRPIKLSLNIEKTNYVLFKQNRTQLDEYLNIKIGNNTVEEKNVITLIGLYIDAQLERNDHIKYI